MARLVEWSAMALELLGIGAIMLGIVFASGVFALRLRTADFETCYRTYRADIGRGILIGLELLIAADILRSLVISPKLESIGVLAGIVFIRTFLSFSLQVEIDGHWPWSRTALANSKGPDHSALRSGDERRKSDTGCG